MGKYVFGIIAVVLVCSVSSAYADKLTGTEYDTSGGARAQQPTRGKMALPQWTAPTQSEVVTPSRDVAQPSSSAAIQNNQHILKYMPGGLAETGKRIGISCTESGDLIQGQSSPLYCRNFSASDGSSWRVAFSQRHQGNAERVFKMTKNGPQLWVQFREGNQQVVYESPGAQQYAMTHGGARAVAQGNRPTPQVASSPCDGLSGNALRMCNQAASALPALGGLLGR